MPVDGANLPIPNHGRNYGGELEVYHWHHPDNGPHPWMKPAPEVYNDPSKLEFCQHRQPEDQQRKILNLRLPTFIISCILLVVTAALVLVGGLLGNKVASLENMIPSLVSSINATASNPTTSNSTSAPPATTTATTPPTFPVEGWNYLGCYYDSASRILPGAELSATNMTNERCGAFCSSSGDFGSKPRHFGTEVGVECHCGTLTEADLKSKQAPDWACGHQCRGRTGVAERCGGNWVVSLWERVDG
ncbi:hypothetical protein N657DRAFT_686544 [Parathielavia appendiculata]|uniref:WSC domain-containing protein n=1 Tax=Parathielavia appendiculata TaxID=2587402 RepID=A0AAN6UCQ4_9PEZI|nr:hypothetical protein N657DRAFT_686544 [Parathielavia appendiculata]